MDDRELVCSGLADTINPACSPLKWLVESPLRSSIPQTKSDATRRLEFVVSFWPKMTRNLKYKRCVENNTDSHFFWPDASSGTLDSRLNE